MGRHKGQAFTCKNGRYRTDDSVGICVGEGSPGSVFPGALITGKEHSLWLEKVIDTKQLGRDCYWLIWYFANGDAEFQSSPILNRYEYTQLLANFGAYLQGTAPQETSSQETSSQGTAPEAAPQ